MADNVEIENPRTYYNPRRHANTVTTITKNGSQGQLSHSRRQAHPRLGKAVSIEHHVLEQKSIPSHQIPHDAHTHLPSATCGSLRDYESLYPQGSLAAAAAVGTPHKRTLLRGPTLFLSLHNTQEMGTVAVVVSVSPAVDHPTGLPPARALTACHSHSPYQYDRNAGDGERSRALRSLSPVLRLGGGVKVEGI